MRFISTVKTKFPHSHHWHFLRSISSFVQGKESVKIKWKSLPNNPETEYHYPWLRDNCPCKQCHDPNPNTWQRLLDPWTTISNTKPASIAQNLDKSLFIQWVDGHQSEFTSDWLKRNAYDGSIEISYDEKVPFTEDMREEPILWKGDEVATNLPMVSCQSLLESDESYLKWNHFMEVYGFCFINGSPPTFEGMKKLFDKVGVVRNSFIGDFFLLGSGVSSDETGKDLGDPTYSKSTIPVPPHTDGSYFLVEVPALSLIQVLSFKGKQLPLNVVIDGFKLAQEVRKESEYHYQLLAHVPFPYRYVNNDSRQFSSHTIFNVSPDTGKLTSVCYNNHRRLFTNSHCQYKLKQFDPKATMVDLYDAMNLLQKYLYNEQYWFKFKLEVGALVAMDNHRILHGRTGYDGERALLGGLINLEDWRAKVTSTRVRVANKHNR